jgi:hypothetical protein
MPLTHLSKITGLSLVVVPIVLIPILPFAQAKNVGITVLAGRGVGVDRINQRRAAMLRDIGKPTQHYSLPGGVSADSWGDGETRTFYRRDVVIQINVQSLADPLPGNITMESSVAQVLARHPGLRRHDYAVHGSGGGLVDYYDDRSRGIAFEFTRPMNPMPGESGKPKMYAVIVHRTGAEEIPDFGETAIST